MWRHFKKFLCWTWGLKPDWSRIHIILQLRLYQKIMGLRLRKTGCLLFFFVFLCFFGLFRNRCVRFGCFETDLKHRNKPTKCFISFAKQTENQPKQIELRFVSVQTEIFFYLFRGHPSNSTIFLSFIHFIYYTRFLIKLYQNSKFCGTPILFVLLKFPICIVLRLWVLFHIAELLKRQCHAETMLQIKFREKKSPLWHILYHSRNPITCRAHME
jgi:hypothetical protein